jgi:hypothetical protein
MERFTRHYDHFKIKGEILIPDPKSAKGKFGLTTPEYLNPTDPHYLREGIDSYGHMVFQLTEETQSTTNHFGTPIGSGFITVEREQFSGGFTECQIHKSKIIWKEK